MKLKKWGVLFVVAASIVLGFTHKNDSKIEIKNSLDTPNWSIQSKIMTLEDVYQGNLLLVNQKHPVQPESVQTDIVNLLADNLNQDFLLMDSSVRLSKDLTQKFSEMIQAAKSDGIDDFIINSGYRNLEEQSQLFQEMGAVYALPAGHSEHNLGLSLDIGSTEMKMSDAPEGKWIEEHAWKYGFVLRYPADKTEITGIQYEPWHIRYVGLPHSAIMKEKNFVLEEYLDYLKKERNLTAQVNNKKYFISYYPISEETTIQVPEDRHYEISGNNMDGIIVTSY